MGILTTGYKKVNQKESPLMSRNHRFANKVAKNRKKASRKGKCSCSRCGRHQHDVTKSAPYFQISEKKSTFTLCSECASHASPEEILGWVMLHIAGDRDGHEENYNFKKLVTSIEEYTGKKFRGEVQNE